MQFKKMRLYLRHIIALSLVTLTLVSMSLKNNNLLGTYFYNGKSDQVSVQLNANSTYVQTWSSCMHEFTATGVWDFSNDTIFLSKGELIATMGKEQAQNMTDNLVTKFLVSEDSLTCLIKSEGSLKRWFKLSREE